MTLVELIKAVRERGLSKQQLEEYHTEISNLFANLQLEMADIEKEEALFMNGKSSEESVANRKITWKATTSGLRLITLKRYQLATKELLNSLKSRIYTFL